MSEQTEIEQALEIARKTRNEILFGKNTLEKNFHGFYTVAQILGRSEDMHWAKSELEGYVDQMPSYRINISRSFAHRNKQIKEAFDEGIAYSDCNMSISELEKNLDPKQTFHTTYMVDSEDFEKLKKYSKSYIDFNGNPFRTKEELIWSFSQSALTGVLSAIKLELVRRINFMIAEITYGKIPEGIFKKFQENVNSFLVNSNPNAVSELNIAYEGLGKSEDPERISHVAFACRRLIKTIADQMYPAKKQEKHKLKSGEEIIVGEDNFLNRLTAFVDSTDSPNRNHILKKINLLRDLYSEIPQSINKGTHLTITNSDAEMLVIYTYLILGEIILEKNFHKNN